MATSRVHNTLLTALSPVYCSAMENGYNSTESGILRSQQRYHAVLRGGYLWRGLLIF